MTNVVNRYRHPAINEAKASWDRVDQELKEVITKVQSECKHDHIIELERHSSSWLNDRMPRRMCLECGYEEEASYWPGRVTFYIAGGEPCTPTERKSTELNGEFVKRISEHSEFIKHRWY